MSPVQVTVLPINDSLIPHANSIKQNLEKAGLRVEVDNRTESLNKKIREAQLNKIPLILTAGAKEKESGTLSVRTLDGKVRYGISPDNFLSRVLEYVRDRRLDFDLFND
jgi:threonyl-tRNA synthetase